MKIAGANMTRDLVALLRKSGRNRARDIKRWLDDYLAKEVARLQQSDRKERLENLRDLAGTLRQFLSPPSRQVDAIIADIKSFYEDTPGVDVILCSTTHRAKGKEADRVFLLNETYLRREGDEEENIFYVAVTRAKRELYFVDGDVYAL